MSGKGALIFEIVRLIASVADVTVEATKEKEKDFDPYPSDLWVTLFNTSSRGYDIFPYEARHGKYVRSPSNELWSANDVLTDCVAEARKELGPDVTDNQIRLWLGGSVPRGHKCADPEHVASHNVTEYKGEGSGGGTEMTLLLVEKDDPRSKIALMVRRRPGGKTGIGVSMSHGDWFDKQRMDSDYDRDGSKISDHIQDVSTPICQFSDEFKKKVSVQLNGIKVQTSSPGKFMTFHIQDA